MANLLKPFSFLQAGGSRRHTYIRPGLLGNEGARAVDRSKVRLGSSEWLLARCYHNTGPPLKPSRGLSLEQSHWLRTAASSRLSLRLSARS
jgi:hypothetical protein